jgi:hypothetical protein
MSRQFAGSAQPDAKTRNAEIRCFIQCREAGAAGAASGTLVPVHACKLNAAARR